MVAASTRTVGSASVGTDSDGIRPSGHIFVMTNADTSGWTSGPLSLRLYAVDPVSVDVRTPSAWVPEYSSPSTQISTPTPLFRPHCGPRIATSLSAGGSDPDG